MSEAPDSRPAREKWYDGITGYQWLVLLIASAGWIFDVFEGQLFAVYMQPAMRAVLPPNASTGEVDWYMNVALASFLFGGAFGGLVFGVLADHIGRRKTMVLSIIFYSVFTGLHFFAATWWHIALLRFFVAMGVGGEWAIAAALVSEVFPTKARAFASGFFHASSIVGVVLAALCNYWLPEKDWRIAFLIGLSPALLILWIRASLKESERWEAAQAAPSQPRSSRLKDLLGNPRWLSRALLGLGLASIGLASYWAVIPWGKLLAEEVVKATSSPEETKRLGSLAYIILNCAGALPGLLLFAPLAARFGRRPTFAVFHVGAAITVPLAFQMEVSYPATVALLSLMAYFVVGMHAGYAIYFPELFPTRFRATGASFCFNVGRLISAFLLLVRGGLRDSLGLRGAVSAMAVLFLFGLVLLIFTPETKDQELSD